MCILYVTFFPQNTAKNINVLFDTDFNRPVFFFFFTTAQVFTEHLFPWLFDRITPVLTPPLQRLPASFVPAIDFLRLYWIIYLSFLAAHDLQRRPGWFLLFLKVVEHLHSLPRGYGKLKKKTV